MKKVILFFTWVILLLMVISTICDLINQSNTISNIVGAMLFMAYFAISVKTKCLTSINIKNESNEK